MKIMIASDIHGDSACTEKMLNLFDRLECDRLLLLGDILYHGPRNNLPSGYAPKQVIAMLNRRADVITAVKGNCDAEVDEMVLDFKIQSDYIYLEINGIKTVATHGHKYNSELLPNCDFDLMLYGHTHVKTIFNDTDGHIFVNPGSVSIPKENNPNSIAVLEGNTITLMDLEGNPIISTVI